MIEDLQDGSGFDELEGARDVQTQDCSTWAPCEFALCVLVELLGSAGSSNGVLKAVVCGGEVRDDYVAHCGRRQPT